MSKKQDQIAQQMLDAYRAALAAAQRKSPEEEELSRQAMETLGWVKSGDFRAPPKNLFFNFADPALRKQQREMIAGAGARGTAALATPNSTALMLDKQNRDDEFDRDTAGNYQENVSRAVGGAGALAGDLASADRARRMGFLGSTQGMASQGLQYTLNKQPWWKIGLQSFAQGFGSSLGHSLGGGFA